MKEILLKMLVELEDLRANQVVLSQSLPVPPTIAEAREAKGLALQTSREFYDKLRKQIEELT